VTAAAPPGDRPLSTLAGKATIIIGATVNLDGGIFSLC